MQIEATLTIDEVRTTRYGLVEARGEIHHIESGIIGKPADPNGSVGGALIFHNSDLKPGQRVKVVFTTIED